MADATTVAACREQVRQSGAELPYFAPGTSRPMQRIETLSVFTIALLQ